MFLLLGGFLMSCNQPVPLYGTWADNRGDRLTFSSDGTFVAAINDPLLGSTFYNGDFVVLLNSLSFNWSDGTQIVSEWDIRGNILYINWTNSDGDTIPLSLYKVSN